MTFLLRWALARRRIRIDRPGSKFLADARIPSVDHLDVPAPRSSGELSQPPENRVDLAVAHGILGEAEPAVFPHFARGA
jgi:hypothetical protein